MLYFGNIVDDDKDMMNAHSTGKYKVSVQEVIEIRRGRVNEMHTQIMSLEENLIAARRELDALKADLAEAEADAEVKT